MKYKIYDNLTDEEKYIRTTVFVDEQGFKEEFDSIDSYAKHLVIYDHDNTPVAVGRFFTDDNKEYHIGRIAVLKEYRQFGYGKKIMQIIENELKKQNAKKLVVSAQVRAKGFYEKCGFTPTGAIYLDEYCEHIKMYKDI